MDFLSSDALHLAQEVPSLLERLLECLRTFEGRWVTERRLKAVLVGGLAALGILAVIDLCRLLLAASDPANLQRMIAELVAMGRVASSSGMFWFAARVALEGSVGLLLVVAAGLLIANRDARGVAAAYVGLLLSLAAVNLLIFYFEQFSTILYATVQFTLLLGIFYYRRRYLTPQIFLGSDIVERGG